MENENRPHNYLKIAEESETGKKLKAFFAECSEASEKARAWAEKQGADTYYESPEGFAGGVAMVEFKNTISKKGLIYKMKDIDNTMLKILNFIN